MIKFIGKNDYWVAIWSRNEQAYNVFYKGLFMTRKFKFSDVESYLN